MLAIGATARASNLAEEVNAGRDDGLFSALHPALLGYGDSALPREGSAMQPIANEPEVPLRFRPIDVERDLGIAAAHPRDSFVVSFGHAEPFDEGKYVRYLMQLSERLPGAAAFALLEGEVVGQIEVQVRPGGTGYVNLFYLVPAWRGRGLGRQLHEYAVALLQAQGVRQIELAVSPTNTPAARFYEKHGYRRLGLRANAEPPVFEMRLGLATTGGVGESPSQRSCIRVVEGVRAIPYRWPGAPDPASILREGFGTCASKHALLAERLRELGIESSPLLVVGPLVPTSMSRWDGLREAAGLLEVHECLTVLTPWAGPLVVDVTWDPPLIRHALPGTLPWSGSEDMPYAIAPEGRAWAVPVGGLRSAKEAIRTRLYTEEQRAVRDRALEKMSGIFADWRSAERDEGIPA